MWRRHYRIPPWAYWCALELGIVAAAAGLITGTYADLFDGTAFDRQYVGGLVMSAVTAVLIATSVTGLIRWRRDRAKARDGLVVTLFHEAAGAKDRAKDVQLMVLDALQEEVPQAQRGRVHEVKATVDLGQPDLAARLLRRLDARALLHGRVVDRSDGGWTVHARLVLPAIETLTHYDWHTSDATPGRMPWAALFSKLPSTRGVTDEEFPLELTQDLAALMQGSVAAVGLTDTSAEMETQLTQALSVKPESATPAMDVLRSKLAMTIFFQGDREDEALDLLRERIKAGDAFGELLRTFAFLAGLLRGLVRRDPDFGGITDEDLEDEDLGDEDPDDERLDEDELEKEFTPEQREKWRRARALERESESLYEEVYQEQDDPEGGFETYDGHVKRLREKDAALRDEILAAVEAAADDERDPRRDMSLYNLVTGLLGAAAEADERDEGRGADLRAEAWKQLDRLYERSEYYRKTWYVKRLCGLRAWRAFQDLTAKHGAHSPEAIEAARDAAKWYSRGIRARPHSRVLRYMSDPVWRRYRVRSARSPILDANAFDAHFFAGHPKRARYYEWRYQRQRRTLLRKGFRDARRGYLDLAFQQLEWIDVERHRPAHSSYDAFEAAAVAARYRIGELMQEVAERPEDETDESDE